MYKLKLNPDKAEVLLVGSNSVLESGIMTTLAEVAFTTGESVRSLGIFEGQEESCYDDSCSGHIQTGLSLHTLSGTALEDDPKITTGTECPGTNDKPGFHRATAFITGIVLPSSSFPSEI